MTAEFHVKVENVVAFTSLGKDIPLNRLINKIENAEYEPEQFPGLVYRTQDPRAAALIFSSGKIVCTGAKSIDMAKVAMKKVVDRVRSTGIPLPVKFNVQVENIVASSKIRANLNLEEIAFSLENAEYEPEQFPGLVYRINDPRVAFLLFSSGKIICTGAHNIDDIHNALSKLKKRLEEIGIKVTPVRDGPGGDVPVTPEKPDEKPAKAEIVAKPPKPVKPAKPHKAIKKAKKAKPHKPKVKARPKKDKAKPKKPKRKK
jgi:transcription initiation factor TFIID TATA-box-binding protein